MIFKIMMAIRTTLKGRGRSVYRVDTIKLMADVIRVMVNSNNDYTLITNLVHSTIVLTTI